MQAPGQGESRRLLQDKKAKRTRQKERIGQAGQGGQGRGQQERIVGARHSGRGIAETWRKSPKRVAPCFRKRIKRVFGMQLSDKSSTPPALQEGQGGLGVGGLNVVSMERKRENAACVMCFRIAGAGESRTP